MTIVFDSFESELDGLKIEVLADDGYVTVHGGALGFRLTDAEAEQFAHAFISACWAVRVDQVG